jgi:hypothetical protein
MATPTVASPAASGLATEPGHLALPHCLRDPDRVLDASIDPWNGRLLISCELPRSEVHRMIWEGTIPLISIDGGDQVATSWGTSTSFDLRIGTHHVRIDVRPGVLDLDNFRSGERLIEVAKQQVHRLRYEAPPIPGFSPRLKDPDRKRRLWPF